MDKKREELFSALRTAERLAHDLREDLQSDDAFRKTATEASQAVVRRVQTTAERAWEIMLQPNLLVALRTCLDAGWLVEMAKAEKTGLTASELASFSNGDPSLTVQLMRVLAAAGIVKEIGLTTYAPNEMTKLLVAPGVCDGLRHYCDDSAASVVTMPGYFDNTDYRLPPSAVNSVFTHAHGTPFFKLLASRPARQKAYESCLAASKPSKTTWIDIYPVERLKVPSGDDVLLVDIAGGRGQELVDFHARRLKLNLPGYLVLQDRVEVVDSVPEGWQHGFVAFAHDFMTPQPQSCIHARAYYMRMTLREFPDDVCVTILRHIHTAMKPGYSTLFIDDIVLPNEGCSFTEAAFAISLMAILSGKERTKWDWDKLIGMVEGLRIEKVWPLGEGSESLIEIVRIA